MLISFGARGSMSWSGAYRNGNGHTNEKKIRAEIDVYNARVGAELVVEAPGQSAAQCEGQRKSSKGDSRGNAPIADEEANIGLETNEEKVQDETEVGDEREAGQRFVGKYVLLETGDAAHNRGTEDDATDDFGNNARLANLLQGPMEKVTQDQDERGLDNEEDNGIRGVVLGRDGALNDTGLRRGAVAISSLAARHDGYDFATLLLASWSCLESFREILRRQLTRTSGATTEVEGRSRESKGPRRRMRRRRRRSGRGKRKNEDAQ
jgi:hypothetical protein